MNGLIDSIEFCMTSDPKHLAQLQYSASQYNDCLGTRSNAPSLYVIKMDSAQSSSNKCKNYLLKIY